MDTLVLTWDEEAGRYSLGGLAHFIREDEPGSKVSFERGPLEGQSVAISEGLLEGFLGIQRSSYDRSLPDFS